MNYLAVFESALYYCTLLLFARYILDCAPKKVMLVLSFLLFAPMLILSRAENKTNIIDLSLLFVVAQFPLLKLIFPEAKIRYLVFFFLFMNCINVMLISTLMNVFSVNMIQMDIISNLLTAVAWFGICLSGLRHKLRQILFYTPKHVLVVSGLLFCAMIMVDVTPFMGSDTIQSETFARFQVVSVSLLQLSVCIAFPVFIMVSASNSRLKYLTSSYEQQIQAQAEHYKALSESNWEVRRFRHDFKNTRIAIEKLLADGDQDQALRLLQECGNVMDAPNRNMVLFDTGNGIADALLTDKQRIAVSNNTSIIFHGSIPQNGLAPTDLCVILGNTVDNALEACEKLPSGIQRTVSITCNCNSGFLFLSVQNPTIEKVLVHDNRVATTKSDKTLHGFGLLSLHSVVKKYDGSVKLYTTENLFAVNIDLYLLSTKSTIK